MFKELAVIAKSTALTLLVTSAGENELKVVVLPEAKQGMNAALCHPLSLTATPEELDDKFASILSGYNTSRKTLEETLEEAKVYMEAAGKNAREAASAAVQKPSKTPATASATSVSMAGEPMAPADEQATANNIHTAAEDNEDLFA